MVRSSLLILLVACGGAPAPRPAPPPAAPPAAKAVPSPAPATSPIPAGDPESVARAVIARLEAHDYAAVAARFDDKMLAALPVDKLEATWKQLATAVGAFDRIESATTRDDNGVHVVSLAARFARAKLTLLLSVDDGGKIGGFFIRPGDAAAEWQPPPYAHLDAFDDNPVTVGSAPALPGVLTLPHGTGPFPAVVLVHGSGPNDADESIGGIKVFKDLAVGLASHGIAVLRYEKRTHATGAAAVKTQKEEVDDAAHAAVALLKTTAAIDRKRIVLLGHSQGGYLGPRIAKADPAIRGLVIFAGSTRPLEDSILAQLKYLATLGPPDDQLRALTAEAEKFKQVVESPALKPDDTVALPTGGTITGAYFLEVRDYHPEKVAASLAIPIAVFQGERDYQVTLAGDFTAWKIALGKRKTVSFHTYPDANHVFVAGTGPSMPAEYGKPGHVEDKVIEDLATWITALPK